jgi:hypothetical protein
MLQDQLLTVRATTNYLAEDMVAVCDHLVGILSHGTAGSVGSGSRREWMDIAELEENNPGYPYFLDHP